MSRAREALRSVTKGISIGVLVLVLALGVLVIGVPAAVGGVPLTILTGSMRPSLPPGTLVIVKPTPVEEIAIGDVVTYQLESGKAVLVTHRVIGRVADSTSGELRFLTQGDANDTADAEPVMPVQIRGTVWYAVPWIGWANQAISGKARAWLVPAAAGGLFAYAGWLITAGAVERARSRRVAEPPPEGSRRSRRREAVERRGRASATR
ncbi:signal peptidase I [Microbacterium sp. JZ31]|uniref:signal peptidase I n=1 Tax=Microbacterium sp. JZ31 TaxID=1906274 RepID=UPI0019336AF3|nr:signal peptidase I [Microbacterium sp. JZ31]